MSRPPYSMYLYARSARGPPYPIYLYAGSASRPPYPIYLYARYASRPPCPIYLCAGSAGRPPYPIYLYVGLLAIVIPEIGVPWLRCKDEDKSNVLINTLPACIHLYGCNNQKSEVLKKKKQQKKRGEPTYWVKTLRSFWLEPLCLNKQSARSKKQKTKPTKGNLPTWSTKRTLRPLHQMDLFFPGVANRYASTSKALVRVIKFRYSFTSSSPPSNELLRIKLLLAHRGDQQPIAPFYFIPSWKKHI